MPTIPGTQVINKIVPTDTADVYPTHEDSYGMGGFQTGFADLTAINAIPAERRKRGMVVYNNDNSNYYRLEANLTTWTNIGTLEGGGGGGGSAYPDSFIVETTAGTRVLTAADQGFITSFVAGVTFQLPDTAADGETYKFTSAAAPIVVDPNGKVVLSFYSANSFTIGVGQHYTLVAINVDIGAGVQLYWLVVRATQLSYPTWDADIYFMPGMLAEKDGILYQCRTAGKNVDPEIGNSAVWIVLKPERELQASEVLSSSDISFAADTAPSNFNNGLVSVVSDGVRGKLVVEYMFDTPGVDVTQIVIDLTAALMANPVLASLVPGGGNPGTCITGALDWPCRLTGTSIVMTIPAGISLTGISGTLFKAVIPL